MTASLCGQQQPLKEKEEEESRSGTEEEYCHCPISNIDMVEEEPTSFLGDTPKKLEQWTRKLSRQLSQQIQYLEGKDTKKLSAFEILADYKRRHSSELGDSNTTATAATSSDDSFMKEEISSSSFSQKRTSSLNKIEEKESKNDEENLEEGLVPLNLKLLGLPTNAGGDLNKSCANPGCGCHGKNCRCPPGYYKCEKETKLI
jgi:hypothetical protein